MTQLQAAAAAAPASSSELQLANIQGNILSGFNKDYQTLVFLQFSDRQQARQWLAQIIDEIATCEEVSSFNALYKAMMQRRRQRALQSTLQATWINIAFTHDGLAALGVSADELASFPDDFKQGMRARAALIGDVNANSPAHWVEPFRTETLHAMLIIASDNADDLYDEVSYQLTRLTSGIQLLFIQEGQTRQDQPGHEHFGFKDGISQPGIRGVTPPNPQNPDQGKPGQDLLWPGEFVLGYPTQPGSAAPDSTTPGPISQSGPTWTTDGSYLVYRRLRQDVPAFHNFIAQQALREGISPDVMGAKLIGRYTSGTPLERTKDLPATIDPTQGDPSLLDASLSDEDHNNNFEYDGDPDGLIVPRAAHIRKAYPRNEPTPDGQFDADKSEATTQTHRLLRRGIPFGVSYQPDAPASSPAAADASFPHDRGLLFLAYQHSIADHFEFVQNHWVNDPNFPRPLDGQDPIIAQRDPLRTLTIPGATQSHLTLMQHFVVTTGGAYLFQPSISALRLLAGVDAKL